MLHNQSLGSLEIVARSASNLKDVETGGKNDAYAQFSLNIKDAKSFQKTKTHKNAGANATWDQTIVLEGAPDEHRVLYVEVMEEDFGADAPIGFTAIRLDQIQSGPVSGHFDLFTPDGKQKGEISLNLRFLGNAAQSGHGASNVRGRGELLSEHQKRVKGLKNKETAQDVGVAVGAGLAALGAAYLLGGGDKKKTEAEKPDAALANH
ncbi:hypothetical protein BGZ74_006497 [Mortierella antarctica]|nr:hypothetical protein BGZ74_006497 [Mortierella antarctica]KAG0359454.1 hypothetical protein BG005_000758 [Podila minutissima]